MYNISGYTSMKINLKIIQLNSCDNPNSTDQILLLLPSYSIDFNEFALDAWLRAEFNAVVPDLQFTQVYFFPWLLCKKDSLYFPT